MSRKSARKPEIVLRNGKPAAVIIDIRDYEKLLERLESAHDLRLLRSMRKGTLKFRSLAAPTKLASVRAISHT